MNSIENAIREAVEKGGYSAYAKNVEAKQITADEAVKSLLREKSAMLRLWEPELWQALGRARGWTNSLRCPCCATPYTKRELRYGIEGWRYFMCRFTYHIAEGKDAESFFAAI